MTTFSAQYLTELYSGPNPAALNGFLLGFVTTFWFRDLWFSLVAAYFSVIILVVISCTTKTVPNAFFPSIPDTIANVGLSSPLCASFGIALATTLEKYHNFDIPAILDHPQIDKSFKDSLSVIFCTISNKIYGLSPHEINWWRHATISTFIQIVITASSGWWTNYIAVGILLSLTLFVNTILVFKLSHKDHTAMGLYTSIVIGTSGLVSLIPYGTVPLLCGGSIASIVCITVISRKKSKFIQ